MWELERQDDLQETSTTPARAGRLRVGIVGQGRAGQALAEGLRAAGHDVDGPHGRDSLPQADIVLLCVPDSEIEAAAQAVAGSARLVGHTSGATPLTALLSAAREGAGTFGLHPLQTLGGQGAGVLRGAGCAVAGSSPVALAVAERLAEDLGMRAFPVADDQRAAYHAAASMASNFLVTLEWAAETLAVSAGLGSGARGLLAPLVRATVENWAATGPEHALTGPVLRGDETTVSAQRDAVTARSPELLPLFDALLERTRALALESRGAPA